MPTRRPIIVPQHRFVKTVANALRNRCGLIRRITGHHRIIIATSGGADSVALLRTMAMLANRRTWQLALAVGHIQHHLREESEEDARFVASLADQLGLPLLRADLDLAAISGNLESVARQQRYKALGVLADAFGASCIVTAHHGDDQLETLLMRFLRGSSVRGLGCMAWRRKLQLGSPIALLRPMLAVNRHQVFEFLNDLNQSWCQDHTNTDLSRLRQELRHDVIPVLQDVCHDAAAKSVATADHMRKIHQVIESEASRYQETIIDTPSGTTLMDRHIAKSMHEVVLITVLRRLLIRAGIGADRIGQRALGPIIRAIRDKKGGQRIFHLISPLCVMIKRKTIEIGPNARKG